MGLASATAIRNQPAAGDFRWVRRALLLILRLHLGVILLLTDIGKLSRSQPFSAEMLSYLQGFSLRRAPLLAPYRHFLEAVVIPHASLFSRLIMAGELVAAISLLVGGCTRVGSAIAMILFLNYMLSKGRVFWSPDSEDAAVFFMALVCLLGAAGRVWGVDAFLARRWPRCPLW